MARVHRRALSRGCGSGSPLHTGGTVKKRACRTPRRSRGLCFPGRCRTVQGGLGSGSSSANVVPQRTANPKAASRFANWPRSPREVDSPSSSRFDRSKPDGGAEYALVFDPERKNCGVVTRGGPGGVSTGVRPVDTIRRDASLDHVVARVVPSPNALPVVDNGGCYCGSVDRALTLKAITCARGSHV